LSQKLGIKAYNVKEGILITKMMIKSYFQLI